MKKLIFLILILTSLSCYSQREDNVWIFGYHYYPSFIPALDFFYGSPDTIAWNSPIEFYYSSDASICSGTGDLLFYTDGSTMCNYLNDTLSGSINFNYDSLVISTYGQVNLPKQSIIILPFPEHPNQYYVFHTFAHIINSQTVQPVRLASSIVDMNVNGGAGEMILKDQTVFSDTLLFGTLQAVKHANGRDWWIVIHRWHSSVFYECLLTPGGITIIQSQNTGPYFSEGMIYYGGQTTFSPDGSHYAIARSDSSQVCIFDFDRCSGSLSFRETVDLSSGNSSGFLNGCSFSPNSKFLYVTDYWNLYQFDMDAGNISASQIHISTWDGSPYPFGYHRLGPDGKIYISTSPSPYLHVINYPNDQDTLCNFTQHSLRLKSYHGGYLPEFPNYRLGASSGPACDTLTAIETLSLNKLDISIGPNPNDGNFKINYMLVRNNGGRLNIYNAMGERAYFMELPEWSIVQSLHLTKLDPGIYLCKVSCGEMNETIKFIKE